MRQQDLGILGCSIKTFTYLKILQSTIQKSLNRPEHTHIIQYEWSIISLTLSTSRLKHQFQLDAIMLSPNLNKSKGHSAEGSQRKVLPASYSKTKTTTQGMKEIQTRSSASATVGNSYYADKDLSWWLQLARDFKKAKLIPLPNDRDDDL